MNLKVSLKGGHWISFSTSRSAIDACLLVNQYVIQLDRHKHMKKERSFVPTKWHRWPHSFVLTTDHSYRPTRLTTNHKGGHCCLWWLLSPAVVNVNHWATCLVIIDDQTDRQTLPVFYVYDLYLLVLHIYGFEFTKTF